MRIPGLRRSPTRTTLLGVAALGVLVWAAVTQVGVSVNSLVAQLVLIVVALLLVAAIAGLCVALFAWLRSRRRR